MKKVLIALFVGFLCFGTSAMAQSNRAARVQYVLKNLDLDATQQKKLKPLLEKYLLEKKTQTANYEDMKDDLKERIDAGTLTDKQANSLLKAKWEADEKELALKIKYEPKFKAVISPAKVFKCYDLLNDKKSKIRGEEKK